MDQLTITPGLPLSISQNAEDLKRSYITHKETVESEILRRAREDFPGTTEVVTVVVVYRGRAELQLDRLYNGEQLIISCVDPDDAAMIEDLDTDGLAPLLEHYRQLLSIEKELVEGERISIGSGSPSESQSQKIFDSLSKRQRVEQRIMQEAHKLYPEATAVTFRISEYSDHRNDWLLIFDAVWSGDQVLCSEDNSDDENCYELFAFLSEIEGEYWDILDKDFITDDQTIRIEPIEGLVSA